MSNPITTWIKACMETYQEREDWMVDRVSENSINAQKLVDETHGPFKIHDVIQKERRTQPNFRQNCAISAYGGQEAGFAGSFTALRYYQSGFAARRDEILTDIAKNG
ncbi:hypothetical protein ACHAXS_002277 [Conticribra weissflogii]